MVKDDEDMAPVHSPAAWSMVVVTPTYGPDLHLFEDLHQSVLRWFPAEVRHVVVVPERDVAMFRRFEGPRCELMPIRDVLPRTRWPVPLANTYVNPRRPWPPLRGWIVQQLVKLAVAEFLSERVIVLVDADIVFIRPVTIGTFAPSGQVRFYRKEGGIDESMTRHVRWQAVARELLGLPHSPPPPLPDYVSSLNTWDGDAVRAMLRRVQETKSRHWLDAVGSYLHFSEWTLYGVHVDHPEPGMERAEPTGDSLCHSYWSTEPLTDRTAASMLAGVRPDDVAVMISAKSSTPVAVRRAALASAGLF